jgi:hypothetical protein
MHPLSFFHRFEFTISNFFFYLRFNYLNSLVFALYFNFTRENIASSIFILCTKLIIILTILLHYCNRCSQYFQVLSLNHVTMSQTHPRLVDFLLTCILLLLILIFSLIYNNKLLTHKCLVLYSDKYFNLHYK